MRSNLNHRNSLYVVFSEAYS